MHATRAAVVEGIVLARRGSGPLHPASTAEGRGDEQIGSHREARLQERCGRSPRTPAKRRHHSGKVSQ